MHTQPHVPTESTKASECRTRILSALTRPENRFAEDELEEECGDNISDGPAGMLREIDMLEMLNED